ncbi:MAG: DUF5317 domain-containing protein [Atribacterota bacterium]
MLYVYIIIISIIIGLLRNGKLSSLSQISLKRIELLVLAFLIQAGLIFLGSRKIEFVLNYSSYALAFSYVVLLIAVWYNKKLKGMKIIALGIAFNFMVIVANGGHMPILLGNLYKAGLNDIALILKEGSHVTHTLITEKTLFRFLADVIPLSPPFPDPSVVSVGDFFMFFGVFSLIQNAMLKKEQSFNEKIEEQSENPEA